MKLKRLLFILIILSTIFLTGCWSSREINTLAIAVCIGIDKTENGYLVTEQVLNPRAIATKVTAESPVVIYTAEGDDLAEIVRRFTTQSSRIFYNADLRMVVFGEDVAKDGIQNILDYFLRNYEYRTDFYFVIAKNSTANEVLGILTPIESVPGFSMYISLKMSEEKWAAMKSVRIIELVNSIIADGDNPVLTGIEISQDEISPKSTDILKQSGKYKKLKYTGLGAFNKDKLVGWLDEDESKGYNYITDNVKNTIEHADYDSKVKITYEIINAKSRTKVYFLENKPAIEVKIKTKCNIEIVEGEFDVSAEENKQVLNELLASKVKLLCEKALNKAQKELKTDIFGFGEAIHRKYPKTWEKLKDDWNDKFTDLPVNITVEAETKQLGQITKPLFMKEKE
ncbi:Ger(x)C family spore germination protein [Acetivibrio saccincola]|jgi:spore germination protein KC|uniref:Spore gernimation protein n=1 Tax=Acetivibrio saccincola TaxID=1677857 RepID=A0A2S8R8Y8_9FIRM|nr:Ger(x)C family spore germination protein [Acetivibrio saccincola]PQQ66263.1 spore gernimation protein [Acetivibrio saccincola]